MRISLRSWILLILFFVLGSASPVCLEDECQSTSVVDKDMFFDESSTNPQIDTTTTRKDDDDDRSKSLWYYIGGTLIGCCLFAGACFLIRCLKARLCPQLAYRRMYKDMLRVRSRLPEDVQKDIEERALSGALNSNAVEMMRPLGPPRNDYRPYTTEPGVQKPTDPWELDLEHLFVSSVKLGSGAYAVVHKGNLKGVPPVAKIYPRLKISALYLDAEHSVAIKMTHPHASDKDKTDLLQEIEFMKTLDVHPHILGMLGCSRDARQPLIVTELCERGDLLSLLRSSRDETFPDKLTQEDLVPLAWQVSDALTYLTSRNMIHRDVAARNVLMTNEKMAKLSDFGLCRLSSEMFYTTRGGKLPIKWMAPESLETAVFTEKTDVWSFGVFLYELFTYGNSPYITVDPDSMLDYLREGNRLEIVNEGTPEKIRAMLKECGEFEASKRPHFQSIRNDLYKLVEENSQQYGYLEFRRTYYDFSVGSNG